jgi:hypothetical protein
MAIIVTRPFRGSVQVECEECHLHLFPYTDGSNGFTAKHPGPSDLFPGDSKAKVKLYNCVNHDKVVTGNVVEGIGSC